MEQIKSLAPSTKNNQSNSFTKQKGKTMLKSISKTAQARLVYQGNIRRKSNLESKIVEQKKNLELGRYYVSIADKNKAIEYLLKALSIKVKKNPFYEDANELYKKLETDN